MAKKKAETSNKYVSASIGAVATVQATIEEGFEKLVAKGEVARKDYRASIKKVRADVRGDITKQVNDAKNRVVSIFEKTSPIKIEDVRNRVEKITDRVTTRASDVLNIPTSKDLDVLNRKIDRVIKKVAA